LVSETQVSSENNLPKNKIVMDEIPASPYKKSLKLRKVKKMMMKFWKQRYLRDRLFAMMTKIVMKRGELV
jgi:hypothetical protein